MSAGSPPIEAKLSDDVRAGLVEFFKPEYEIYDRVSETGQWAPPAGHIPGRR